MNGKNSPAGIEHTGETPILVPREAPFSNTNIYVVDQLLEEPKTDLESTTFPLLSTILHWVIRRLNKKLFRFENWPTPGSKSGVFR
jgi:hypothetical protein